MYQMADIFESNLFIFLFFNYSDPEDNLSSDVIDNKFLLLIFAWKINDDSDLHC